MRTLNFMQALCVCHARFRQRWLSSVSLGPLSSHVSILRTQSVIRSPRQLDAVLVVGVTLLCIAAPLVATNAAIAAASGIVVLAALAW